MFSISQYLNIRQAYAPTVTSDGSRVAFLTNITGIPQVWAVDFMPDSAIIPWPEQLTFAEDRVMDLLYSPLIDDERLIYAHDVGGNENAQLFLLQGGWVIPLTQGYEKAMHLFGDWSADGQQIIFAANRRDPGLFDLYLQPLDGEARMVWQNQTAGYPFSIVFSPDHKKVVFSLTQSSSKADIFLLDLESGQAQQLTSPDEQALFQNPVFDAQGKSLYVTSDYNAEFLYIARLNLDNGDITPLIELEGDIQNLTGGLQGRLLAFTLNRGGYQNLYLYNVSSGDLKSAPNWDQTEGTVAFWDNTLTFSADSKRLFFSYTSSTRTVDIYVWDFPSDQVTPITRSSHGGIPQETFRPFSLIHYPTFDGRQIPAWLCKPKNVDQSLPVIVMVHGGPESQVQPYFNFLAQYFVHHGFAVLAPNVRGSTGYGKTYHHLDDVRKRMDSVADLAHAAYWLAEQPAFDKDRIAVYGGSYGGFMVLSAMTTYPDLWAAGVNIVGISNFVTFLENTSDYRRAHREAEYGSLEKDRQFLERISPINHIDKLSAPLFVIHGANDPRVPLGEAQQLVAALQQRGVTAELLVFDDEGHGIVKLKNKLEAYPSVVDFLKRHLL